MRRYPSFPFRGGTHAGTARIIDPAAAPAWPAGGAVTDTSTVTGTGPDTGGAAVPEAVREAAALWRDTAAEDAHLADLSGMSLETLHTAEAEFRAEGIPGPLTDGADAAAEALRGLTLRLDGRALGRLVEEHVSAAQAERLRRMR